LETIQKEKEKIEQKESEIREWTEDNNEMNNMVDPYYEL